MINTTEALAATMKEQAAAIVKHIGIQADFTGLDTGRYLVFLKGDGFFVHIRFYGFPPHVDWELSIHPEVKES